MASGVIQQRYWDANVCLAYLNEEPGSDGCQIVLDDAENGKIEIVISALTIAEVLNFRGKSAIPKSESEAIRQFFRNSFFLTVDLDRYIAELAQDVVWDFGIKPRDAIHVATALACEVPILDTFDKGLLNNNGRIGDPPLIVCKPGDGLQSNLDL